jgi:hypothetical protein
MYAGRVAGTAHSKGVPRRPPRARGLTEAARRVRKPVAPPARVEKPLTAYDRGRVKRESEGETEESS